MHWIKLGLEALKHARKPFPLLMRTDVWGQHLLALGPSRDIPSSSARDGDSIPFSMTCLAGFLRGLSRVSHNILCQKTAMTSPTRMSKTPDPILNFFRSVVEDKRTRICPTHPAKTRFPTNGTATDIERIMKMSIVVTVRKSKNPGSTPM